jgi:hypothetical protein
MFMILVSTWKLSGAFIKANVFFEQQSRYFSLSDVICYKIANNIENGVTKLLCLEGIAEVNQVI